MEHCIGLKWINFVLFNQLIWKRSYPTDIYLLKVNDRNTRKRCEICSKLTIKAPDTIWFLYCSLWTHFTTCSSVFIVNFEQVNPGWIGWLKRENFWELVLSEAGCRGSHVKMFRIYKHPGKIFRRTNN